MKGVPNASLGGFFSGGPNSFLVVFDPSTVLG